MRTELQTWDAWHKIHQPFELGWWKEHIPLGHLDDPGFRSQWDEVAAWIELQGTVIDIGCGPRPPFVPCTAIDPLIEEYQKITPAEWWEGVTPYAKPAEELIPGLKGDTIICWNALDHTIGWRDILKNMRAYANPGAKLAVATDFFEPFDGHPGYRRNEFYQEIKQHFRITKKKEPFGRALALMLEPKLP